MTAVVVSVTLLVFACLTIAWCRYCEVSRDVDVVVRNTPSPEARDEAARARLTALFNDTPKGEDRG